MTEDFDGKVVIVAGGTRGIGLATGLAFAKGGAHVYLTHRWSSADEDGIQAEFAAAGARPPTVVLADAAEDEDTEKLLRIVRERHGRVDVFVSNVCVVMRGAGVEQHRRRNLHTSLKYSAWPFVGYLQAMKRELGCYPRHAIAISSDGPDRHYPGYDYVAVSKAVVETFCRYLSRHLRDDGVRVNVVRARQVVTAGYGEMFDAAAQELASTFSEFAVSSDEVADAVLALCGGGLDAMSGQVIQVDRGAGFVDNIMTLGPRLMGSVAKGE